jgi:hypothetical protein
VVVVRSESGLTVPTDELAGILRGETASEPTSRRGSGARTDTESLTKTLLLGEGSTGGGGGDGDMSRSGTVRDGVEGGGGGDGALVVLAVHAEAVRGGEKRSAEVEREEKRGGKDELGATTTTTVLRRRMETARRQSLSGENGRTAERTLTELSVAVLRDGSDGRRSAGTGGVLLLGEVENGGAGDGGTAVRGAAA